MKQSTKSEPNLVSNRIRGALAARGYMQKDGAGILGISEASFSNKLAGRIRFSAEEISSLSRWLNVSSDALLGRQPVEVA